MFEGPSTGRHIPVELVLLFDTSTLPAPKPPKVNVRSNWDRNATYAFANQWDEAMSKAILNQPGADIRVAIYHFDHNQLERICAPTKDPGELASAFHRLLTPVSASNAIPLVLPPGREDINARPDFQKGQTIVWGSPGWLYESVIAAMKDAAAAPGNAMRLLAVFAEGYSPTSSTAQDAADQATALGVQVFPVVLDYDLYIRSPFAFSETNVAGVSIPDPRAPNDPGRHVVVDVYRQRMLESLAVLTDGRAFSPPRLTAKIFSDILESVRDQGLSQYVVGFAPGTGKSKRHRLEIRLKSKSAGKVSGGERQTAY